MRVGKHARNSLVALTGDLPVPASVIIRRLERTIAPPQSIAIEVARLQLPLGTPDSSNGDQVIVIVRKGEVKTAMLRRSWNQPFTPEALRVDECVRLQWNASTEAA